MPFLTAGDPDLDTTAELLRAAQEAGASICELGIAFSDPIADGPIIQESMNHALTRGVRPAQVLERVARLRSSLTIGLVAMVSYSIVHRLGPQSFLADARQAGIDGFIVPDLPVEESPPLRDRLASLGLTCSFLIAPTTPDERAERIARACTGFVYVLSRSGLTGERAELPVGLSDRLRRLRSVTDLPLAVGFGVSGPDQVRQVTREADAAIVGSAIMRRIASSRHLPQPQIVAQTRDFMAQLATGLT
jgi:tryptophan synthase alpha chain